VEPPARHRRKHAAWRSSNGTDDVTLVKAYRVFAVTSPLSFAIVDQPDLFAGMPGRQGLAARSGGRPPGEANGHG
jgi:hypothetical protein